MPVIPPYLVAGDTIGLICPSGYMPAEKVETCYQTLQAWGFKVKLGTTIGHQFHYFSGTDERRMNDLQDMLDDVEVKAVLCARGGYGLARIIDKVHFKQFKKKPKWVIGYSDITLLLSHIYTLYGICTIHAPMAAAFNDGEYNNEYVLSLKNALLGFKTDFVCGIHYLNKIGLSEGKLVGGNLALLAHATGTASQLKTKRRILFIEDVGEYTYTVDRMMQQLKRSGQLDHLAGLIVGGFTDMKDTTLPFGKNVYEAIHDVVKEYDYPVCFGFPVGHQKENFALKVGGGYQLGVKEKMVTLKELG